MSLQKEIRIIPITAWVLAVLTYIGVAIGVIMVAIPQSRDTSQLPVQGQFILGLFAAAIPAIYILLIGYIYSDSKRRGMRHILWTLLAIFIPNAIGIILYFVLRDPMPCFCPNCGGKIKTAFTFCPQCAVPLRPTCAQCGRAIEDGWSHCPHCGTATAAGKPGAVPTPPAAPQPL
jgi:hypothetical protein